MRPKKPRARRAKPPAPGPSAFYLMLAPAEMENVNGRAISRAQREQTPPVDYGVLVKQGFVCGGCQKRLARMVPLRRLVHEALEMPDRCNACASGS